MTPVDRLNWVAAVAADPSLPPTATKVAAYLASCVNGKTGQCNPSLAAIAEGAATSDRSVKGAISALLKGGLLKRKDGGRGRGNRAQYAPCLVVKKLPPKKEAKITPVKSEKGGKFFQERGQILHHERDYTSLDEQGNRTREDCEGVQKTLLPEPEKNKPEKQPPPTAATWDSFATAYRKRYGVDPIRNATINGQLANFVRRLGREEAPEVAAYYVTSNNAFYVRNGHAVGLMVKDAEKLRTEWITGRQVTQTQATQADRSQSNFNAAQEAKAILANRSRTRG